MKSKIIYVVKYLFLLFLPFIANFLFYSFLPNLRPSWSKEILLSTFTSNLFCALLIMLVVYLMPKYDKENIEKPRNLILIIGLIFGILILYLEIIFFQLYLGHDIGAASLSLKGVFFGSALYAMLVLWPLAFFTVPWATVLLAYARRRGGRA